MAKSLIIFIISFSILFSCGSRSGISNNNSESAFCGVKDRTLADTSKIVPHSEPEVNGLRLFMLHCRQCHAPMDIQPCVGKSLRGISNRLPSTGNYFKVFIQNSDSLKRSGDPYANKIEAESNMNYEHNFKNLTDKEINDILAYTNIEVDMN